MNRQKVSVNDKLILIIVFIFLLSPFTTNAKARIGFIHDKDTIESIHSVQNAKFQKRSDIVYQGINNGVFWFKIQLDVDQQQVSQVIELENAHIYSAMLFSEGKMVPQLSNTRFLTFIINTPTNKAYFLKVVCKKEAVIPINIFNESAYYEQSKTDYAILGLYYGAAIMVVLFNLFFFFSLKEQTFLLYVLFLIAISLSLLSLDGLVTLNFGNNFFSYYFESFIHFLLVIAGVSFATNYLQLSHYIKKATQWGIFLIILTSIPYAAYIIMGHHIFYVLGDVIGISVLFIYWLLGCYTFNKSLFAKFFTIAYSFILFLAIDFQILPELNLPNLSVKANDLKISGLFEMIILSFAVTFRMRILSAENRKMYKGITHYLEQIESLENILNEYKQQQASDSLRLLFTAREIEILELVAKGKTNKEIADETFVSINTVKFHIKNIYEKLEVKSRKEVKNKIESIQL